MDLCSEPVLKDLLSADQGHVRGLALQLLSECYAADDEILPSIIAGWQRWGAEAAYPDFPMLSHIPIPRQMVGECCSLAHRMTNGYPLTAKQTRCGGKLIEHLVKLPARCLVEHEQVIEQIVASSKIFFRVDLKSLRQRVEFCELSGEDLADHLDSSIATLAERSDDTATFRTGLNAMEAMRSHHPHMLDMDRALRSSANDTAHHFSFQIALQSLIDLAEPNIESALAELLSSAQESVLANTIEALVRCQTPHAGLALMDNFHLVPDANKQWLARGLQRLRIPRMAAAIAELRASVREPRLWLMLLIAEIRQLDIESCQSIAMDVDRIASYSEALANSLTLFNAVHAHRPEAAICTHAYERYLRRARSQ
ncbi:MAG: hypothetical protein KDB22_05530 [Planctomycetales bacterium]|nr:hypothetical protein [Planctomycetales bacterium]